MSRQHVRQLKKSVRAADAPVARESALALLKRSISFGHDRLALLRLSIAIAAGADVPQECWIYCRAVVDRCGDNAARDTFETARLRARAGDAAAR